MLQSAPPHLRHFIVHLENTMWCTSTPKDRRSLHGCRRCLGKELLNALSAETFFSDGVFLVEGTSEVLFYTALARELKLDLDRHNISILSVEGVGFKPYVLYYEWHRAF